MQSLENLSGQWGEVLVAMLGYNDPANSFVDAVESVLGEAKQQGVDAVVWLTLRVADVDYEEPLHEANSVTYREANETLLREAGQSGGYLQVADWATYSDGRTDWFEPDGVHVTRAGAPGAHDVHRRPGRRRPERDQHHPVRTTLVHDRPRRPG